MWTGLRTVPRTPRTGDHRFSSSQRYFSQFPFFIFQKILKNFLWYFAHYTFNYDVWSKNLSNINLNFSSCAWYADFTPFCLFLTPFKINICPSCASFIPLNCPVLILSQFLVAFDTTLASGIIALISRVIHDLPKFQSCRFSPGSGSVHPTFWLSPLSNQGGWQNLYIFSTQNIDGKYIWPLQISVSSISHEYAKTEVNWQITQVWGRP